MYCDIAIPHHFLGSWILLGQNIYWINLNKWIQNFLKVPVRYRNQIHRTSRRIFLISARGWGKTGFLFVMQADLIWKNHWNSKTIWLWHSTKSRFLWDHKWLIKLVKVSKQTESLTELGGSSIMQPCLEGIIPSANAKKLENSSESMAEARAFAI